MSGLIFRVYMLGPIFNIIKPTFDNSQQLTPTEDALSLTNLQCQLCVVFNEEKLSKKVKSQKVS